MEKKTPEKKAPKAPRVAAVTVAPNEPYEICDEFNGSDFVAVKVPAKVKDLYGAFKDCPNLKSVHLPASVKYINGFVNCPELEEVHIPKGIETIHPNSFKNCPKLKVYIKEGGQYNFTEQDGVIYAGRYRFEIKCVVNPVDLIIPNNVVALEIDDDDNNKFGGFTGCTSLRSITLHDGITSIGKETFKGCSNLESINIPNSIKSIHSTAFVGCDKLKISWGDSFYEESGVVYNNRSKTKIMYAVNPVNLELPDSITAVEIRGCDTLESIIIPASVKSGGLSSTTNYHIEGCCNLLKVVLPNGTRQISSFTECPKLSEINIPNSVEEIRNVTLLRDDKIKKIWGDIFFEQDGVIYRKSDTITVVGCLNPKNVTLIDDVTEICSSAFEACESLESIVVSAKVRKIDMCAFEKCTSLKSVILPDGISEIGWKAFADCLALEDINLPESITSMFNSFPGCDKLNI